MTALPDWMRPPREEGWFADDLDRLPEAPRHTELIDGALVFMMSPRRWWHGHLVTMLTVALMEQVPSDVNVGREMTIKLDERNRPEPDLLLTTAAYDGDRTWFAPDEVRLVIEVVSSESAHRDRTVKLRKYAEAGIPHYWCIEEEDGAPVVHVYELDEPTGVYAPAGIFRGTLKRPVPFEISLDLDKLTPPRSRQESVEAERGRQGQGDGRSPITAR
jgi:Uma2 family endonuclease